LTLADLTTLAVKVQTHLQAILDATMDVVAVFDSQRRFVSVNEAACRFYERGRAELLGCRLDDFIGTERAEADWAGFLEPERIAQGMLENVWDGVQDGRRVVLEVRARPEFLPDRHLFVLRDITERRVLEDQLRQAQKMEAVGQLAGGIAHDFNNLLTVIAGYGELARRRIGAGPGANELGEISRAAERGGELTRQLLAFARRQVLEPVLVDVNEVAAGLVPMLSRLIGETIEIAMLAADDLPPVLADRVQLEQVIVNLAINARDAMPGGGTLAIETSVVGDHVRLAVSDTGTGIAPDVLERIFEPFYTTKAVGFGTGLGLATVHGIVTQSGGRVDVISDAGLGSTFTVSLPAAADGTRAARLVEHRAEPQLGGDETLLLCEDEDGVRALLELVLTGAGYTVLAAGHPEDALAIAAREGDAIDALVSDIVMPGMSGLELALRLAPLRTLFISGYSSEVAGRGALPAGSAFLEKPFDHGTLLAEVRTLLDAPLRIESTP
jgi:two-component system cell cycle sensor histidine kinase/response regulator CckA